MKQSIADKINRSKTFFYFSVTSVFFILPAIYNGYPLFYSDSAVYIKFAMLIGNINNDSLPYLSGIGYAFFMRLASCKATLWLVIMMQGLILNLLIYRVLLEFFPRNKLAYIHFFIILVLVLFSSCGWTASQLMPDIFTSFLILATFLIYSENQKKLAEYILLSFLIEVSILSHLSNLTIAILNIPALIILFAFRKDFRASRKALLSKTILMIVLISVSVFTMKVLNKKYYNQYVMSPTGHIFLMARLADAGFMNEFLNERCKEKSYNLCEYKDCFPESYEKFLWDTKGAFYQTGGWDITQNQEYKQVIRDVLTTPKYFYLFALNCSDHFLKQTISFRTGDGLYSWFNRESSQYQIVLENFNKPEIRNSFQSSKQIRGRLNFKYVNILNDILLAISLLIIIWCIIKKLTDRKTIQLTYVIISGLLINAVSTSAMSSVFDRFQSRVIWLLPFLACIYIVSRILPNENLNY
ncbi:MAG TPA: hypothetical protein PK796_01965 [Bacteroidales bacterium]|jgi:hypothetical protein|nr:hypothetical protein [Bacteroidales bacterium]